MVKKEMTKEEIIKLGGIIGVKYMGKEFPRYALLRDGSLYFKNKKGLFYTKQSPSRSKLGILVYALNQYFDDANGCFDGARYSASSLMLENFKHIDATLYVIKFKDGNKDNIAIDNLEYYIANTVLATIAHVNIFQNFYHSFINYNEMPFFKDLLASTVRRNIRYNARHIVKILNNFSTEELKLIVSVLDSDDFRKVINVKSLHLARMLHKLLRYYLGIQCIAIDYSCILHYNLNELIAICKIAKECDIHDISKTKHAIEQIKYIPELDKIKLLSIIYCVLRKLDLDELIKLIKSFDNDINIDYAIKQLADDIKAPRVLINCMLKTNRAIYI